MLALLSSYVHIFCYSKGGWSKHCTCASTCSLALPPAAQFWYSMRYLYFYEKIWRLIFLPSFLLDFIKFKLSWIIFNECNQVQVYVLPSPHIISFIWTSCEFAHCWTCTTVCDYKISFYSIILFIQQWTMLAVTEAAVQGESDSSSCDKKRGKYTKRKCYFVEFVITLLVLTLWIGHVGAPLPCNLIRLVDVPEKNYFAAKGEGEVSNVILKFFILFYFYKNKKPFQTFKSLC